MPHPLNETLQGWISGCTGSYPSYPVWDSSVIFFSVCTFVLFVSHVHHNYMNISIVAGNITMCCSVAVKHLLLLISIAAIAGSQAPRDEDEYCRNREDAPTYNSSAKTLMDSYNYLQLLPGNGTGSTPIQNAVWNDRSVDEIDANTTVNPTFVRT